MAVVFQHWWKYEANNSNYVENTFIPEDLL